MIAAAVSITFTAIIIVWALYINNKTAEKPNGNILLGVSLPHHALTDSATTDIVKKYHRAHRLLAIVFLLLSPLLLLMAQYIFLAVFYLFAWLGTFIILNQKVIDKYFTALYALKAQKGWWMGTQEFISIDTEVSRLKNTFPIANTWFIIPVAVTACAIFIFLAGDEAIPIWSVAIIAAIPLLIVGAYFAYSKVRTVVYSDNTDVNIALNRLFKREWTLACLIIGIATSVQFLVISLLSPDESGPGALVVTLLSFAYVAVVAFASFGAYNKIRSAKNRMRHLINEEVYEDDDLCWMFGAMFYNNPNDHKVFVEKRIGIGLTINIATWSGKVILACIAVALAAVLGYVAYYALLDLELLFS
ncbi:MAG: DUF5808 domain-containing protein [Defluviitaleaceae bacterium]|nr:DUF5808 domain-containing protein [Defluviitaleaceae bacterium]